MAAPPEPAAPAPAKNAPGSIFEGYQVGTVNDMFAPAYIKGFAPSEEALKAWTAYNRQGAGIIDASRMPNLWQDPAATQMSAGDGVYGGPMPLKQTYGDNRGQIDPEALRIASQGGHYDIDARRSAIAARLAENAALQAPKALSGPIGDGSSLPVRDPMEMYKWPYAGDQS
jgi:hypothetical protein